MELSKSPLHVLMAEDEPDDVEFFKIGLQRSGLNFTFHQVADGEQVIEYLTGKPPYDNRALFPMPALLLLDIKMPRLNGFDVLTWLHAHPDCAVIPTIIFSSSSFESDVKLAYQLGANSFMEKPTDMKVLVRTIQVMCEYWSLCKKPILPHTCLEQPLLPASK